MSERGLSVCISVDFDAMSVWIGLLQSDSLTDVSRGEFGAYALPRILELVASAVLARASTGRGSHINRAGAA